ncbi:MAG TPA: hypothetical protein VMA30_20825, partial [Xanthobacteraceae bacterium]|nr:hypothetical protein [Xanthobacteraceae bacterium]
LRHPFADEELVLDKQHVYRSDSIGFHISTPAQPAQERLFTVETQFKQMSSRFLKMLSTYTLRLVNRRGRAGHKQDGDRVLCKVHARSRPGRQGELAAQNASGHAA